MHHFELNVNEGESTGEHAICEDLILVILQQLPSKPLLPLRRVSRLFAVLVDEVLRGRFSMVTSCNTTELILESCAPYNSRAPSRQVIEFSHFDDSTFPVEGVSAHFTVATRDPQYVPLDDDEMFANNLLGVTLESIEAVPIPEELMTGQPRTFNMPYTRIDGNSSSPPRQFSDFAWQLCLASSLDRLFREWFLIPKPKPTTDEEYEAQQEERQKFLDAQEARRSASPPSSLNSNSDSDDSVDVFSLAPSPTSSRETTPYSGPSRRPKLHLLNPSNAWPSSTRIPSAFKSTSLECLAYDDGLTGVVEPLNLYPFKRALSPGPLDFEYYFQDVCLDVAKVVVAAEHGLKGKMGNPFTLWA
ncbi:hypothetical protein JCM16303_007057 [Sporobolomyces ruberrimus]